MKQKEEKEKKLSKYYSDKRFWEKVKKNALKAGSRVIYTALLLYFTLKKENLPLWAKGTIVSALGYFIFPFDAIADVIVPVGFADDMGVLMAAVITVAMYIDEPVKMQAKDRLRTWFGEDYVPGSQEVA